MTYNIVALPGDGIGPEILNGTLKLLQYISHKYQFDYQVTKHHFGGASIDHYHVPLTAETLEACQNADAILLELLVVQSGLIRIIGLNKAYLL